MTSPIRESHTTDTDTDSANSDVHFPLANSQFSPTTNGNLTSSLLLHLLTPLPPLRMAMSAANALRTAGRGAALRPAPRASVPLTRMPHKRPSRAPEQPASVPLTRMPHKRPSLAPEQRAPAGGRGGELPGRPSLPSSSSSRSALSASVLAPRKRRPRESSPHSRRDAPHSSPGPPRRFEMDIGKGARIEQPRSGIRDWFSSAERTEALEAFAMGAGGGTANVNKGDARGLERPFAWRDFDAVVSQLPEAHWATGYVRGVAQSLEGNANLSAQMKERMLDETLSQLSELSQIDAKGEEQFQDA